MDGSAEANDPNANDLPSTPGGWHQLARPFGCYEMTGCYASPTIRDQFLAALDTDDRARSTQLALNLAGCLNPLPGMTCKQLGLPIGSTYASAAQYILSLYPASR
jgi:hypothetical protein